VFISWFNVKLDTSQTIVGQNGGLKSVSWIAGRVAHGWHKRADVLPSESYWFVQLLHRLENPCLEWPAFGFSAITDIDVTIAWDHVPYTSERLLISPLDPSIIQTMISGLQFATQVQRIYLQCNTSRHADVTSCTEVYLGSSGVQTALDSLKVSHPHNTLTDQNPDSHDTSSRSCGVCRSTRKMHSNVAFPWLPHVIQVIVVSFQPTAEALNSVLWLGETFDLVGWIELNQGQFGAKVVVDGFVYSTRDVREIIEKYLAFGRQPR
jgi:hypothetical protein